MAGVLCLKASMCSLSMFLGYTYCKLMRLSLKHTLKMGTLQMYIYFLLYLSPPLFPLLISPSSCREFVSKGLS